MHYLLKDFLKDPRINGYIARNFIQNCLEKENLNKSILDATAMYSDNIRLDLTGVPAIEIVNIGKNEILDFILNYLQLITNC